MSEEKAKDWFGEKSGELAKLVVDAVIGTGGIKEAAFEIDRSIQKALREAHQRGQTDAHRKEFVVEQPTHFERGMT